MCGYFLPSFPWAVFSESTESTFKIKELTRIIKILIIILVLVIVQKMSILKGVGTTSLESNLVMCVKSLPSVFVLNLTNSILI